MSERKVKKRNQRNRRHQMKTDETDASIQLMRCPHLLRKIFNSVSYASLLKAENVSPLWKQMISMPIIWRRMWRQYKTKSLTWKTLASRLKHENPKWFGEMKEGGAYRQACGYVDRHIQQHAYLQVTRQHFHLVPNIKTFAVNHKHLYIGLDARVMVINRWTKDLVKEIDISDNWHNDLQLNDQVLALKLSWGTIIIIDLKTHETIQRIVDEGDWDSESGSGSFFLGSDVLINMKKFQNDLLLVCNIQQWDPSARQFGPVVKRIPVYSGIETRRERVYLDQQHLIVDVRSVHSPIRIISVYNPVSMKPIRRKVFHTWNLDYGHIKEECHHRVIVVEDISETGDAFLVAWNIKEDSICEIANVSLTCNNSRFLYSSAMDNHPDHQFILSERSIEEVNVNVFSVDGRRSSSDQNTTLTSFTRYFLINEIVLDTRYLYFDGVQCIFKNEMGFNFVEYGDATVR